MASDSKVNSPLTTSELTNKLKNLDIKVEPTVPTNQLFGIIPKFSDTSKNLNTFIKNIKYVVGIASPIQKYLLLPHLISLLDGKAASFANNRSFDSVDPKN